MPSEAISWGEKGFSEVVVMVVIHQEDRGIFYSNITHNSEDTQLT
jgi:hypothetical protein